MCEVEWYNLRIIVTSQTYGPRVIQAGSLMGDRIAQNGNQSTHHTVNSSHRKIV